MDTSKENNKRKYLSQEQEDDLLILQQNEQEQEQEQEDGDGDGRDTHSDGNNKSNKKKHHYLSYTDRYFKLYYRLDVRKVSNNDHLVMMHSNRVAILTIAPSHPLMDTSKYRIDKITFLQQVNEEMSGKHKHYAKNLNVDQPLVKVYVTRVTGEQKLKEGKEEKEENEEKEDVFFLLCSCLNAKLIETNERLVSQPSLLQRMPATEGFLAILMPKIDDIQKQIAESLVSQDQYRETMMKRRQQKEKIEEKKIIQI